MFVGPRFLAIDDKPQHLNAIITAFQQLGSPCMGIEFDASRPLDPKHFRGVRVLCLDLHLIDGLAASDDNRHFAVIADILETNIHPAGGPFVLVIWTEHAHLGDRLREYLEAKIDSNKPFARPVACLTLAKELFINVRDGVVVAASGLRDELQQAVVKIPQFAALLNWEIEVLSAAGATLAELFGLVAPKERTQAAIGPSLDSILSRLAREAVGQAHVGTDPRAAVNAALAPILSDRIMNSQLGSDALAIWTDAVTRFSDQQLASAKPDEAGRINRMMHISMPTAEAIRPTDWGAVVKFPIDWRSNDKMQDLFDLTLNELLGGQFLIERADRSQCGLYLIRIGASCDYAQNRPGPISYLFAVETPVSVKFKTAKDGTALRRPASEWSTPVLLAEDGIEPFYLRVNARFLVTLGSTKSRAFTVRYRLRESVLMHLISHASAYVSRPGIVQLPAN